MSCFKKYSKILRSFVYICEALIQKGSPVEQELHWIGLFDKF